MLNEIEIKVFEKGLGIVPDDDDDHDDDYELFSWYG